MRSLVILFSTGCTATGVIGPPPVPTNGNAGCEDVGPEYVVAGSHTFRLQQLLVDQLAVVIDVNSTSACVRSDGAGVGWQFDRLGEPYGVVRVETTTVGNLVPDATNFVVDLIGEPVPVRYTGTDFDGNVVVDQWTPTYDLSINGTASQNGRTLIFQASAVAAP